ncbi:MAG: hypothetical protein ACI9XP_001975 [Lentimonas sp.]|jgi:hypothetical protein
MKNTFFFCQFNICPVRSDASDAAEMVTQLAFGEIVEKLEESKQWVKIRTYLDNYEGWIDEKFLRLDGALTEKDKNRWLDKCHPSHEEFISIETPQGKQWITKGGFLPYNIEDLDFNIGSFNYKITDDRSPSTDDIIEFAMSYLNTPYLWGGKSNTGIDCSGFTQAVFRMFDKKLPRDAYEQAEVGMEIPFSELQNGDLAFFKNESDKITHVGICLDGNKIIHAHGSVRIDTLTDTGILNEDRKYYSHHQPLIKRI